ncbi:hypothetical protein N9043_00590 [bacterium]|nr:hypothetical protein [bacterium]
MGLGLYLFIAMLVFIAIVSIMAYGNRKGWGAFSDDNFKGGRLYEISFIALCFSLFWIMVIPFTIAFIIFMVLAYSIVEGFSRIVKFVVLDSKKVSIIIDKDGD